MDGWMDVTKNTEAHEQGPEQELDACLITVSLCFFVVFFWCQSFGHVLSFCPVLLMEKRRVSQNTLQT